MTTAAPDPRPRPLRLAASMALLLVAGCTSGRGPVPTASLPLDGGPLEPVAFSDQVSRDLIRQTQSLLTLQQKDYLVGADDVLEISVFEWEFSEQTRTLEFRVSETGEITLPVLGPVRAAGRSIRDIQTSIVEQLSTRNILQNPRVAVSVKEYRSRRIGVVGAVNAPGVYALHRNVSTLMDVLTLAGGPSDAAGEVAYVLRKEAKGSQSARIAVDLNSLLVRGDMSLNPVLQGDDVLFVPKAPLFFVYGNVRQPGGFSLQRPTQLLDAIALAGGPSRLADRRECRLTRRNADGSQTLSTIDLVAIENGKSPNLYLRGGDVLQVPQSSGLTALSEAWDVFRGIFTFTYRLDSNN